MIRRAAFMCQNPKFGGEDGICCESCQEVDPNGCFDKFDVTFGGEERKCCGEWVGEDWCRCHLDPMVGRDCCASCASYVDKGASCNCRDLLSEDNTFEDQHGITHTSCKSLFDDTANRFYCRADFMGGMVKNDMCCRTCQCTDPNCLDDPNFEIDFDNGTRVKRISCSDTKGQKKAACEQSDAFKQACCATCETADGGKMAAFRDCMTA
jgi:hypothetical protein